MYVIIRILEAALGFLRLPITPIKTTTPPAAAETAGAMMTQPGIVGELNDLKNFGSPVFGNFSLGVYSGVTNTLAAKDIVGGFIRRNSSQSNADLTDTATNIVNAIPGATVGQTWMLWIANLGAGSMTLAAGNGVSFVGTATIQPTSVRCYIGQVLGSASVSLTTAFTIPSGTVL